MQSALCHGPGAFSALSVWRASTPFPDLALELAAQFLDEAARFEARVLLGVSPQWAAHAPPPFLPRESEAGRFPSTQSTLLVQVAAETREALMEPLRRLRAIFRGDLTLDEEVLGGRLGIGRDAFGFRDGVNSPSKEEIERIARIAEGEDAGGSWLLYLRMPQDLERFATLRPRAQERVIGLSRDAQPIDDAPADSHVSLARAWRKAATFVRRGFPFRDEGEEGLVFVAASARPESYPRALDVMLGREGPPDALLRYAQAVSGGLYFAPPDADWLRHRRGR